MNLVGTIPSVPKPEQQRSILIDKGVNRQVMLDHDKNNFISDLLRANE